MNKYSLSFIAVMLLCSNLASAFYNPEHGRFITRDPLQEKGGENLYRFVSNDPINRWDLLGLVSLNLLSENDNLHDIADQIPSGGMTGASFTVGMHGSEQGGFGSNQSDHNSQIPTQEIINQIQNAEDFEQGQQIEIVGCFAGNEANLPEVQEIAASLGSEVIAATGLYSPHNDDDGNYSPLGYVDKFKFDPIDYGSEAYKTDIGLGELIIACGDTSV